MREVLEALLIAGVVVWISFVVALLWVRSRLRRTLRIDPSVRSAVPTTWVVSPTAAARLHRRLRVAAASARLSSTRDQGLSPLVDELVGEAVALEPGILAVARTRRAGASVRRDLSTRVAELEVMAQRLASLSTSDPSGGIRLRDRLAALEAAREELADIDLRAGLLRHL